MSSIINIFIVKILVHCTSMSSTDSSLGFDSAGLGDDTVMLESLKS